MSTSEPLHERHEPIDLVNPVLLVLLDGWVDAGRVLDRTTEALLAGPSVLVASFDTDLLVDYRSRRPTMHVDDGVNTGIDWPRIDLLATRDLDNNDVLVLTGTEPDRCWRRFAADVLDLAQELGVRMLITLGAYPAATPHTRGVTLSAIGTTPALIEQVGYLEGRLDTTAGVQAAIERTAAERRIPSVGLWAPVPHYTAHEAFPAATLALLQGLEQVGDRRFITHALATEASAVLERLDVMQSGDEERRRMVDNLESHADTVANVRSGDIPKGDEFTELLQRLLDQDGEAGDHPGGGRP